MRGGAEHARDVILKQKFFLDGPVAQLVEHRTFNAVVAGSSPARLTIPFYFEDMILKEDTSSGCRPADQPEAVST